MNNEEIGKGDENKNSIFLKYSNLSWRYDSFMLLQILQIYIFNEYFTKFNIKLNCNENSLFYIGNYNYSLSEYQLNKWFLTILSDKFVYVHTKIDLKIFIKLGMYIIDFIKITSLKNIIFSKLILLKLLEHI